MKLFFCGDFTSQTGPGIANQNLREGFYKIHTSVDKFIFSIAETKLKRLFELRHIVGCKAVILCNASNINFFAIFFAKLLHVKVVYLAHGLSTMERSFYSEDTSAEQRYENRIFFHVDRIVAVSERFSDVIKEKYKQYAGKVTFCYNSVPDSLIDVKNQIKNSRKSNRIISVGGAMYQKCMLPICDAVERINKKKGMNLEFMIVGGSKDQIEEISKYSCVTYIEHLSHEELLQMLQEGGIYVQNSLFETFGLTVVEALSGGCDLLLSAQCGVTGLFAGLRDGDIIRDNMNIDEIARKIENLLKQGNWKYLDSHFNWEMIRSEAVAQKYLSLIKELL